MKTAIEGTAMPSVVTFTSSTAVNAYPHGYSSWSQYALISSSPALLKSSFSDNFSPEKDG
ncbi:hypothetical protein [Halorubrum sp. Atlit-26R]|uniref:hypothetical protein n=1 Tax=Halorubrum sp. Atlit-26R TaxID=2282128 RepID=UPI001F3C231E|nr:hypothetical protein [Halorubrum sp. Atlit-26R]